MARRRKTNAKLPPRTKVQAAASVSLSRPNWDHGTGTQAQRHLTVIEGASYMDPETGEHRNPNGVKRRRRVDWCEVYRRNGKLSERQFKASDALVKAWENTQKTGPAIKAVQVDSSPKPDAGVSIMLARISGYHDLAKHIPSGLMRYVDHVVMGNKSLNTMAGCTGGHAQARYLSRLQDALDSVADALKY